MNKKLIALASAAVLALPVITFAVNTIPVPTTTLTLDIPGIIDLIFNSFIWPIVGIITVFFFIMAGFQFVMAQGDPGKVEVARQSVIWAFAGVAVLVLSFSIPFIVKKTLGL